MNVNRLKVAVVGTGNIGFHHTRIYKSLSEVELIACVDPNPVNQARVKQAFSVPFFDTISDLIKAKPDAVSICVPTQFHYEIAKPFLEAGIHCLVEKPLATDLNHISELIELAKAKNVVLTVGQIERFNPAIIKLKELIKSDVLGDVVNIIAKRVGGYPPELTNTGVFFDLAVHDLDIILDLLGEEPISVRTQKLSVFNTKVDDASAMFLEFKRASAMIQVNWITPVKIRTLSVTGTKGYAEVNYINQSIDVYARNVDPLNFEEKDFHEFLHKFSSPQKEVIQLEKEEPLKNELQHFIQVILGNQELRVKPEQALITMKWLNHD